MTFFWTSPPEPPDPGCSQLLWHPGSSLVPFAQKSSVIPQKLPHISEDHWNSCDRIPKLGATNVEWTLCARYFGIPAAFCFGIAVGPTNVIRTLTVGTTMLLAKITVSCSFRTTRPILAWFRFGARVVILSSWLKLSRRETRTDKGVLSTSRLCGIVKWARGKSVSIVVNMPLRTR